MIGAAEHVAVQRVLDSGVLTGGEEVERFEAEFSGIVGHRHCVAVNSGTSALVTLLRVSGIGVGDEVIVPGFTFAATANAVVLVGATPVFADIDLHDYCIHPDSVAAQISARTRAVIAVHLYGHPAPMVKLREITVRAGILLFEDAAQAHLAALHGTPSGALGDGAAFSFHATKNMTTGEGGMVVVADAELAGRACAYRNQGMTSRDDFACVGGNLRMTSVAAAIGRVQLNRLPWMTQRRRENAEIYRRELAGPVAPVVGEGVLHAFHQYTVRVGERDRVRGRLADSGIETRVYYPTPLHRSGLYPTSGGSLPGCDEAAASVLSIPVGPHVSPDEIRMVARELAT